MWTALDAIDDRHRNAVLSDSIQRTRPRFYTPGYKLHVRLDGTHVLVRFVPAVVSWSTVKDMVKTKRRGWPFDRLPAVSRSFERASEAV
jgi:hypothetical protein